MTHLPDWQLGRAKRKEIRRRLERTPAFWVRSGERKRFVEIYRDAVELFRISSDEVLFFPISSLEATSEIRTLQGSRIVLVDQEQINSLNFILALRFKIERPLFHFVEYSVRAAERALTNGDQIRAIAFTDACLTKIKEYSEIWADGRGIPRPIFEQGLFNVIELMEALTPAVVFGHEIGHLIYGSRGEKYAEIFESAFDETVITKDTGVGVDLSFQHFGTDIGYRIRDGSLSAIFQNQSNNIKKMSELRSIVIEEAFCDLVGVILALKAAQFRKIPIERSLLSLMTIFEGMDQLRILGDLCNSVSLTRDVCTVHFRQSRTASRWLISIAAMKRLLETEELIDPVLRLYCNNAIMHLFEMNLMHSGQLGRSRVIAERAMLEELGETREAIERRLHIGHADASGEIDRAQEIWNVVMGHFLYPWSSSSDALVAEPFLNWEAGDDILESYEKSQLIGFFHSVRNIFSVNNQIKSKEEDFKNISSGIFGETLINKIREPRSVIRYGLRK